MNRTLIKVTVAAVVIAGLGGGAVASAAPTEPSSVPDLRVVVRNDATEPVPVNGTVSVGNLPTVQTVKPATLQQVLLQGSGTISSASGLPVLLAAVHNNSPLLTTRIAISNITLSNPNRSDAVVRLSASVCGGPPFSKYGALNLVVAPARQTVQLNFPTPLVFPPNGATPDNWCLYAAMGTIDTDAGSNPWDVNVTVVASIAH